MERRACKFGTFLFQFSCDASGNSFTSHQVTLNFPRNCRRLITSPRFKRQPLPLALRIPRGPRVGAISQQEKFSALERKAEGPFRSVARSFATTSARTLATLSLGDAARSGEASAAVASAPALLRPPRGGLESAVGGSAISLTHCSRRARLV